MSEMLSILDSLSMKGIKAICASKSAVYEDASQNRLYSTTVIKCLTPYRGRDVLSHQLTVAFWGDLCGEWSKTWSNTEKSGVSTWHNIASAAAVSERCREEIILSADHNSESSPSRKVENDTIMVVTDK